MQLPEHARAAALADVQGAIQSVRVNHYWVEDDDYDESGNRIAVDGCYCGADWPCTVVTLLLAYDEMFEGEEIG